jgi:hypothetical protein
MNEYSSGDIVRTRLFVKSGGEIYHLDDPSNRQRYVKNVNPKQQIKFANFYTRAILKAQEECKWLKIHTLSK